MQLTCSEGSQSYKGNLEDLGTFKSVYDDSVNVLT